MPDAMQTGAPQNPKRVYILWVVVLVPGILVALALLVVANASSVGLRAFTIQSSSMEPTVLQGDRILAQMTYYSSRTPKDRDIILFRRGKTVFIKRVIASGGETVQGSGGVVYVDGKTQTEPYVQRTGNALSWMNDFGPVAVPAGQYFVMGDNRDLSLDSRSSQYGCVRAESVEGKPLRVLYNPQSNRMGKTIQ